jgi:hypothetical protein
MSRENLPAAVEARTKVQCAALLHPTRDDVDGK